MGGEMITRILAPIAAFLAIAAPAARAGEVPEEFRIKRREVFEFAKKPVASRKGDRVTVTFATKDYCDVTIAVENPEGRIVRHLASGVLGKNAPPPFRKGTLEQAIVWDGKDDRGRYIDEKESHSVRVSLGLRARFERHFMWSPHRRIGGMTPLFCAQPEGVYVFGGCGVDYLRLFDHDGNYLRTVYPFPRAKLEKLRGVRQRELPQSGRKLPLKWGFYESTLLSSGYSGMWSRYMPPRDGAGATAMAVARGRIALAGLRLNRLGTDGSTGGMPLEGPETSFQVRKWYAAPRSAALSPDGKRLYVTGFVRDEGYGRNHKWVHGVGAVDMDRGKKMELFAGSLELGKQHAGSGPGKFRTPSSVDCDARGRVYVADHFNDRVQVFDPAGKHLKSVAVRRPSEVCVDRRRGDIYVFSWFYDGDFRKGNPEPPKLRRFGPFEDPKLIATCPLRMRDNYMGNGSYADRLRGCQYRAAIDSWAGEGGPAIWMILGSAGKTAIASPGANDCTLGGRGPSKRGWASDAAARAAAWGRGALVKFRLEKGKLVLAEDFSRRAAKAMPRLQVSPYWRDRLYVRPTNGQLYVLGNRATHEPIVIDPETGRSRIVKAPFSAEDMAFDMDGLAYLRTHKAVVRYDPDTWREVPFDYGEQRANVGLWMGKKAPRVISALPIETRSIWHQGGFWVSPKGYVVVSFYNSKMISGRERRGGMEKRAFSAWRPWTPAMFPGRAGKNIVRVWDRYGKVVYADAVPGLGVTDGVAMDRDDNIYALAAATRMFGTKRYWDYMTGTLVKFGARGNKVLSSSRKAKIKLADPPERPPDLTDGGVGRAWAGGAKWFYGGLYFTGKDGGHAAGGCACWNGRFAHDYFARSFAPETQHYTVAVLDSAGNLVMRIGQYGNVDDGKPMRDAGRGMRAKGAGGPQSIGGDEVALFYPIYLATHSDRRLFVTDPGNQRIVSVKLDYHASERIELKNVPDQERRR
jgi:sugar lactone lactonase YvrE